MTVIDTTLDEEVASTDKLDKIIGRLNEQSVRKHFDAYVDVPWDEYPIDPTDARWELSERDGLGATAWYQAQPQDVRARLGLDSITAKMQIGYFFEGVLKKGLLVHAERLPAGSPELRYVYHEVIEEAQHSLMFQEFCGRAGRATTPDLPWDAAIGTRLVVSLARIFPELFFVFVLGGEDPIDHMQRETLRNAKDGEIHPLLERIMRIHVTEEARHLSFARHWLKSRVPALSPAKKRILAFGAPMILGEMGGMMMRPPKALAEKYAIPAEVLREAYDDNPEWQAGAATALRKVRMLCRELGLMTPRAEKVWKQKGIWQAD